MLRKCFSPNDITESFIDACEFEIHPTNAGMILKDEKIKPIGYTKDGNKLYDGIHWEMVFAKLFEKALHRCEFDDELISPLAYKSLPDCPEYYVEEILLNRPYIDYGDSKKVDTGKLEIIEINVPYFAKETVKKLGAKWNKEKKTWFIYKTDDYLKFAAWLPKNKNTIAKK